MIYINNEKKLSKFKNISNYYVIADFDRTLTTRQSEPTMGIIPQYLGGECLKQRTEIFNHYRPLELDYTINQEQKQQIMREWATKSFTLLSKYTTEETIEKSIENANIYLREGTKDFLYKMYKSNIPVIIMSSGVGNIVKLFLKKENCLYDNIKIVSNFFEFNNGIGVIDINSVMATSNKDYKRIPEDIRIKIETKKALLFGDLLEDIKMADKENLPNTLKIGFLDVNIEENLNAYKESFDILLTNNANFTDVKNILDIK